MIGLGNDYLVNSEFAWAKSPSKNLLGYFPRSSVPVTRHNRDITPYTLSPCSSCCGERVCGVWKASVTEAGLGGHLSGKNRLNEMSDLGNLGD